MANPYGAYQLAGIESKLIDNLLKGRQSQIETREETGKQRGVLKKQFEKEIEDAQAAAKRASGKHGKLFKGLKLLSALVGPGWSAAIGAATSGAQTNTQRKALRKLLGTSSKRWEKTFLKDASKRYTTHAQEKQMSKGDIGRSAVFGGLQSYLASDMLGGGEGGGVFKGMFGEGSQAAAGVAPIPGVGPTNLVQARTGPLKILGSNIAKRFNPMTFATRAGAAGLGAKGMEGFASQLSLLQSLLGGGDDMEDFIGNYLPNL